MVILAAILIPAHHRETAQLDIIARKSGIVALETDIAKLTSSVQMALHANMSIQFMDKSAGNTQL